VVVYATHSNRAEFLQEKDAAERARVAEVARVQRLQRRLTKLDLTIRRHCNEQDKMFGSVTAKNIADKLEKSDLKVSEKDVLLEEPIREVPRVLPAMVALALV
jgi:large subunit ribosomal protein L9